MKRYQIIKKDDDIGIDEGMDYNTIKEAIIEAKKLLKEYQSIFIYDRKSRSCRHAFNGIPDHVFSKNVNIKDTIYHWRE